MIAYRVLRALGRLALRWFYRDIEVVGMKRLPVEGPVLLASNHPNALIDALVVGCMLPRLVVLTAKATLLKNPITRLVVRTVGVVPLRRASDAVPTDGGGVLDPGRGLLLAKRVLLPLPVPSPYGVESTIGCRFESRAFSRCG